MLYLTQILILGHIEPTETFDSPHHLPNKHIQDYDIPNTLSTPHRSIQNDFQPSPDNLELEKPLKRRQRIERIEEVEDTFDPREHTQRPRERHPMDETDYDYDQRPHHVRRPYYPRRRPNPAELEEGQPSRPKRPHHIEFEERHLMQPTIPPQKIRTTTKPPPIEEEFHVVAPGDQNNFFRRRNIGEEIAMAAMEQDKEEEV